MSVKAKWIQYSTGVISFIGVILTGVLWYERDGANIHAEDEAECAAATWERSVVPFLFGTDLPSLTVTNVITDSVTNYYCTVTISRVSGSTAPRLRFHGNVPSFTFTETDWNVPIGLYLSYDGGGLKTNEPPAETVFRLTAEGQDAAVDVTVTLCDTNDYGEFITSGKIKVRSWYKFTSETDIPGQVSLHSSPVGGPTFTVINTTNTVNYAGDIYKIDPYLRKGSDDSLTKGIQSISSLLRSTALYSDEIKVRWLDTDEDFPANGNTLAQGYPFWTNTVTDTERLDGRTVKYYTLAFSNYTESAVGMATVTPAIEKWYWSEHTNYYDMDRDQPYSVPNTSSNFFPIGSLFGWTSDKVEGAAESALEGNWWTRNNLGTNVWRYGYEYLTPSNEPAEFEYLGAVRYIRRSSFVTTNILNEMKTLAEGMTRTVCWIPNGLDVAYTNCREYEVESGALTNFVEDSGEGSSYPKDWDNAFSAATSGFTKGAYTNLGPGTTINLPLVSIMGSYYAHVDGKRYLEEPWLYNWVRTWGASISVQDADEYYGCSLPYPSLYAITNGYVSSMSIFAVVGHNTLQDGGLSFIKNTNNYEVTYSGTFPDASEYNDIGFGYVDYTSYVPPFEQSADNDTADLVKDDIYSFWQARLNLVGTWSNPTEQPTFDFGTDFQIANPPYSIESVARDWHQTMYGDYSYKDYDEEHYLYGGYEPGLAGFVVVVDWNWKHLNPLSTFVPTNFVPDWITSNTNRP